MELMMIGAIQVSFSKSIRGNIYEFLFYGKLLELYSQIKYKTRRDETLKNEIKYVVWENYSIFKINLNLQSRLFGLFAPL